MGKGSVVTPVVFLRPGSFGRIDTLAVYEFTHSAKLSGQDEVIAALRRGITRWVQNTTEGKKAWKYSSSDMNIGDVGDDPPIPLRLLLNEEGISGYRCACQASDTDTVPYDTVLVDDDALDDDDDDDEEDTDG